jgi:hypothetical protein
MSTVIVPARVGPKVFADVPSAKELDDAKRAIDNMRRGRTMATIWLILFAGALVAAGVFIFLLLTRPIDKPSPENDPVKLKEQIADLDKSLAASQRNFEDLQKVYAPFAGLPDAEVKFKKVSSEILPFVQDTAKYGNIERRTIRANPAIAPQWVVYKKGVEKNGPVWKGENAAQVKADIDQQVTGLEALLTQIKATGPVPPPEPCVGPSCP